MVIHLKLNMVFKLLFIITVLFTSVALNAVELPLSEIDKRVVEGIRFEGNSHISTQEILSSVTLNVIPNNKVSVQEVRQDVQVIYFLGYFKKVDVSLDSGPLGMIVVFHVIENPLVQNVFFEGNQVFQSDKLTSLIRTKKNVLLSYKVIDEDIAAIEAYYKDRGYSLVKVKEVKFDAENNTVTFTLSEGTINNIVLSGNKNVSDKIILREMESKRGEVFNSFVLRKDRERIVRLGYFSTVSAPRLIPASEGNSVDVAFDLVERKINAVGLALEEGLHGINAVANLKINNVLGIGEAFTGRLQWGRESAYSAHYFQPWIGDAKVSLGLDSWVLKNAKVSESKGWDVVFGVPFDDYIQTFYSYKSERVTDLSSDPTPPFTKNSLGFSFSLDNRNDYKNTKTGERLSAEINRGGDFNLFNLGGINFYRIVVDYSKFHSFFNNKHTLAFHTAIGTYKTSIQVPDSEKFLVGGTYTVRGYIDAVDSVRGLREVLANIEYRIELSDYIRWVFFYDVGSAFDDDFNAKELLAGSGTGLRFATPLGALRFDLGFSGEHYKVWSPKNNFVFHFGLGELF